MGAGKEAMGSRQLGYELNVEALIKEIEADTKRRADENGFAIRGASERRHEQQGPSDAPAPSTLPSSPPLVQNAAVPTPTRSAKRLRSEDLWDSETAHARLHADASVRRKNADPSSKSWELPQPSKRAKRSRTPSPDPGRTQHQQGRTSTPSIPTGPLRHCVIHRQWGDEADDCDYERLRNYRRMEKVRGVDRYVPNGSPRPPLHSAKPGFDMDAIESGIAVRGTPRVRGRNTLWPKPVACSKKANSVGYMNLPDKVQDQILGLLLVDDGPITLDFSWLLPFVKEHSTFPSTVREICVPGTRHTIPVPPSQITLAIKRMQTQLSAAQPTLNHHVQRYKPLKSPTRGLATPLLLASRAIHTRAAQIFYSKNTFAFPIPTSAWLTLESFLATVGSTNTSYIRHIRIHAPLWHPTTAQNAVEGAVLDSLSSTTRLAVVKPLHSDRLLSAIETCTGILLRASTLQTLSLDLGYPDNALHWIGRHLNTCTTYLLLTEVEAHVARKAAGIASLKQLGAMLGPERKPVLTMCNPSAVSPPEARIFRSHLAAIIREAEKYRWGVDQILREPGRTNYRGIAFGKRK